MSITLHESAKTVNSTFTSILPPKDLGLADVVGDGPDDGTAVGVALA